MRRHINVDHTCGWMCLQAQLAAATETALAKAEAARDLERAQHKVELELLQAQLDAALARVEAVEQVSARANVPR